MIRVLYYPGHTLHDPTTELYDGLESPYAEKADRIEAILDGVRACRITPQEVKTEVLESVLSRAHKPSYIEYIKQKSISVNDRSQIIPSIHIKDTYTPVARHTYKVALHSAGLAQTAAKKLAKEPRTKLYALCRPPGHHAEDEYMGGYCYFNNVVIAAEELVSTRKGTRVAILDIDYHHGNGTQRHFYERSDVLYVSLHADPQVAFPFLSGFSDETGVGEGEGYTQNYPLDPATGDKEYVGVLEKALKNITDFEPDYLLISLGFDAHKDDPIGGMRLTEVVYREIGAKIAATGLPVLVVQEGGYNVEKLAELAKYFIEGFDLALPVVSNN